MGLVEMKTSLHDRLRSAQKRWFALRAGGATKRELKMRGIRESGDANRHIRNLIFTGSTKRAVEETLKSFIEFAHEKFGVERLEDLSRHEFKALIEDGVARGLAASTLEARCSHLAKLGALCPLHAYVYFPLDLDHRPKYPGGSSSGGAGCWPR